MMSFRSSGGISLGEIYNERISNARSSKIKSRQSDSQELDRAGISSGMKRPPSAARPFRTTSSKDSCSS